MEIFDAHVHIYPPERQRKLVRWVKKFLPEHPIDENITPDGIMKDLEKSGVTKFINLIYPIKPKETESLNQFNADLCKSHKHIYGFASLMPQNDNKESIIKRAFYDLDLIGLKFHPFIQRIDLRDPAMEEVWTICEELKRPIFIHTGYEIFYNRKLSPLCVRDILTRHPELDLVLSHSCFPELSLAFQMARDFPGVCLDLTNVPGSILYYKDSPEGRELRKTLVNGTKEFKGRIFFGTDHPVGMSSVEEIINQFNKMGIEEEDYRALTYTSMNSFIERFSA